MISFLYFSVGKRFFLASPKTSAFTTTPAVALQSPGGRINGQAGRNRSAKGKTFNREALARLLGEAMTAQVYQDCS